MRERIIDVLKQIKPELDEFEKVGFISQGILDSFDIIALCEAFNKSFGIKINGEDIVADNFETVDSMVSMILKNGAEINACL